ncbi:MULTISPECIES: energy-coupling factor transporter transmembrane component T [unclassified Virgibacillus]|uniref:energy-coupling factor transporter transmembrane component T family protein n=1 Tax=unclassified Virgibacillus TaxID=2620237 RepID=UPI0024DE8FB6|nr:energy-coupling factor transporter transmembrane component T [Virgibacillus sp. LDC-1]
MFLHQLNPSVKALTIVVTIILLALVFDPITPALLFVWTITLTFIGGQIHWKRYVLYLLPFSILSFGMLWTTLFVGAPSQNLENVIHLFGLSFSYEALLTALALALRVLSVAALSLLFIFTTDMVDFILSLNQQMRLSPKIAYGVLAGFRFLPMMKEEWQLLHAAHRIRGARGNGYNERWKHYKRFAIPLLASAIRKAERTAIAMESKGFTGDRNRTYYRQFNVKKQDGFFFLCMLITFLIACLISNQLGFLKIYPYHF